MASKAKTVEFKIKSPANFQAFLKRFIKINKTILLEVHENFIQVKSNTEDRSILKHSRMYMSDVFEPKSPMGDMIKVGIIDITKVIKIFAHFSDSDEIFMTLKYEPYGDSNIATELLFHNPTLKIKVVAADTTTFNFLSDEMIDRLVKSISTQKIVDFPFPKDAFVKMGSLCSIDNDNDFLTLKVKDSKIAMRGKSFEYQVGDAPTAADTDFTFYNAHMSMLEQEISTFTVSSDKMIIKSQESDTMVMIGRVE